MNWTFRGRGTLQATGTYLAEGLELRWICTPSSRHGGMEYTMAVEKDGRVWILALSFLSSLTLGKLLNPCGRDIIVSDYLLSPFPVRLHILASCHVTPKEGVHFPRPTADLITWLPLASGIWAGEIISEVKSLSLSRVFATPWTVAHQGPPSMGFSRQEYWSGLPLPERL